MTAGHLISDLNLSLLSDIATYNLIYSRRKLIRIISGKYLNIYDNTVLTVRNAERCIPYLTCLFTEDSTEKSFLCRKLCFTLRSNLTYKDVS